MGLGITLVCEGKARPCLCMAGNHSVAYSCVVSQGLPFLDYQPERSGKMMATLCGMQVSKWN